MSAYSTALHALRDRLDSELALLRQREHAEALSVVEAATERCRILQAHLDACQELRRQHLGGHADDYQEHYDQQPYEGPYPYQELGVSTCKKTSHGKFGHKQSLEPASDLRQRVKKQSRCVAIHRDMALTHGDA